MPEYLSGRANGVLGVLKKLIQEGRRHAIETGAENITPELPGTLAIGPAGLPGGLDPDAGEVPDIPAAPAPAARKRRKPRNTAFDDHGVPASGTGN